MPLDELYTGDRMKNLEARVEDDVTHQDRLDLKWKKNLIQMEKNKALMEKVWELLVNKFGCKGIEMQRKMEPEIPRTFSRSYSHPIPSVVFERAFRSAMESPPLDKSAPPTMRYIGNGLTNSEARVKDVVTRQAHLKTNMEQSLIQMEEAKALLDKILDSLINKRNTGSKHA